MTVLAHGEAGGFLAAVEVIPALGVLVVGLWSRRNAVRMPALAAGSALLLAASPPLVSAAERSTAGHMVQHLVLIAVAGPALAPLLIHLPGRHLGRWAPLRGLGTAVAHPLSPLLAGAAHVSVLALWHVPGIYDAALAHDAVHYLEHLMMLGSAVWWWAAVYHHARRTGGGNAITSMALVATVGAAIGVTMMFAPRVLYAQGDVRDQQFAGALMASTGAVYAAGAIWLVVQLIDRLAAPRPPRMPPGRASHGHGASHRWSTHGAIVVLAALTGPGLFIGARADLSLDDERGRPPADAGRVLYLRDCSSCHGPRGEGTTRGTPLTEVGTATVRYSLSTGRMPITDPRAPIRRGEPAYGPDEIRALLEHVDAFVEGPGTITPDAASADVANGGVLYRRHCAACHGAEGIGGGLSQASATPALRDATPEEVADAIVAGPGTMPAFAAILDPDGIADVAAYVRHLQDPGGPGVRTPGGRVTEGLVGLVIGVGALVLAARWLTRYR